MNKKILTTHDISQLLKVDINTVQNWIKAGHLEAYRTPGRHRRVKGDDFMDFISRFNLPAEEFFQEKSREEKPRKQSGGKHFLVVDDEEPVRRTIKKIIKKTDPDIVVHEAPNGFRAGALLAAEEISLVFLDIEMPGIDGFEVMEYIKKNREPPSPEIVVITGYPQKGLEEKVKKYGAKKLLLKPFDVEDIRKTLEGVIKK